MSEEFFRKEYVSPLGKIVMYSDGENLVCLTLEKQHAISEVAHATKKKLPIFDAVANWLDIYFSGNNPLDVKIPICFITGSEFARRVWGILQKIPYGETTTYGEIAKEVAKEQRREKMSTQAVGGAVGKNPIAIIVPCHRVISANGSLTGYHGGIEYKKQLLQIEKFGKKR